MLSKIRFIIVLISLSVCLGLMSSTYSRYVADTTSNIDVLFAKWQILVNNNDITNSNYSSIEFVPVIEENENVANNVLAPSSKGYFDINIDPSNADVSFSYAISLSVENENMPDLMITKYAVIPNDYVEGDTIDPITLTGNIISDSLHFDKTTEATFKPFTIRVYFEWYDGENDSMDDSEDTAIGNEVINNNTAFKMNANISFEQIIE